MISEPPTCKLSVLLIVLLVNHSTGELEFYQDGESETSEDVDLDNLERLLETQGRQHGLLHRPHVPHRYPPEYEDDLREYIREKEKIRLERLLKNPEILEILQKNTNNNNNNNNFNNINDHNLNHLNYPLQRHDYNNFMHQYPRSHIDDGEQYINLPSPSRIFEYPKVNVPYSNSGVNNKIYYNNPHVIPMRMSLPKWGNFDTVDINNNNDNINPLGNLERQMMINHHDVVPNGMQKNFKQLPRFAEKQPKWTYNFNDPKIDVKSTFAVKPNDPRYYQDDEDDNAAIAPAAMSERKILNPNDNLSEENQGHNEEKKMSSENKMNYPRSEDDYRAAAVGNSKFSDVKGLMSKPQRQTIQDPIITPSTYKLTNDVYFIAIVAGCSAAAMFALVLIGLTWCRLQRGAKAAADIEYPAYGVTGPNKDILPSGDQRLAHSAQMYHFQHQKQQIIAMEKTAARDPGSVSEVESDEENEEGDYTVYECPGLAPAGEMEVKNPLFHDDSTPATPPVNPKDGNRQHH